MRRAMSYQCSIDDDDQVLTLPDEPFPEYLANTKLVSGSCSMAHPEKEATEDAYFVSKYSRGLGVADGVGGWANEGIDPGFFARSLMRETQRAVDEWNYLRAYDALDYAYKATRHVLGASTACVAVLSGDALSIANVGDSSVLVLRRAPDGRVGLVLKSPAQQHDFNIPYQLGPESHDSLADAASLSCFIHPDDHVVLASDGLFDNVWVHDIMRVVDEHWGSPQDIADTLALRARAISTTQYDDTPFSKDAMYAGLLVSGGKMDDITVTVSVVRLVEELPLGA
jgi:protein phosphatase PTC7